MSGELTFFDTNVLVYAFDTTEALKREKCKKLVFSVFRGETKGLVSNQVLAELFFVLTKKVKHPYEAKKAANLVKGFIGSGNWIKVNYSCATAAKATGLAADNKMHFWDALIAGTMLENQAFEIITENGKDFSKIGQIKAVNPVKN